MAAAKQPDLSKKQPAASEPRRRAPRRPHFAVIGVLVLVGLAAAAVAADWWTCLPEGTQPTFVGRQSCVACHASQVKQWTGSDHDLAMDHASPETVLGDFNSQTFTHFDVTSKMERDGDKFFMTTEGPTGKLEKYEIKYTFGVRPLQQYLVEFPGGRLQALSIAWDTRDKKWFHLYPNERIEAGDPLHWTGREQNWNHMCADCHSTNLQKNYDAATDTFHTTWSEIDVSCETCHGPASLHVDLAHSKSLFWDRRYGKGLVALKGPDANIEISTCAPCHARRRVVEPGMRPGHHLLDHFEPVLLDDPLYHADGQIQDEVYEHGSFLQSKMYRKNVRCSDCHNPHSTKVYFQDNQLCAKCHIPAKYDTPGHHHHRVASGEWPVAGEKTEEVARDQGPGASEDSEKGGAASSLSPKPSALSLSSSLKPQASSLLCVDCHMPTKTYMVVDPRRDHSLRVPRPDLTVSLGTPNACNGCHQDKSAQWASDAVVKWYGPKRADDPHYGLAIAAGRDMKPNADQMLAKLAQRPAADIGPIVRATAISLLQGYGTNISREATAKALQDSDPLVRAAAIRNYDNASMENAEQARATGEQLRYLLAPLLGDPVRAVRIEAARVLAQAPRDVLSPGERKAFDLALEEYVASQTEIADRPEAHMNLALLYEKLGQLDRAEASYRHAMKMDAQFAAARLNLAGLLSRQAEQAAYQQMADVAQAKQQQSQQMLEEGTELLARDIKLAPQNANLRYRYGLALYQLGRLDEAEQSLVEACRLDPDSADLLLALTLLYERREKWHLALESAERLIALRPQDPGMRQVYENIRAAAGSQKAGPAPPIQ